MTITTIDERFREVCIRARVGAGEAVHRLREERGQTAAEYMGVLLLVALVIFALVTTLDIDGKIANRVSALVDSISGGTDPSAGGGGGGGGGNGGG